MRRGEQGGSALLWGMAASIAVLGAVTSVSSTLARQAAIVRAVEIHAAEAELLRSAQALADERVRRSPTWTGPETLNLAGGSVELRLGCVGGRPRLHARLAARASGGTRLLSIAPPAGARCSVNR